MTIWQVFQSTRPRRARPTDGSTIGPDSNEVSMYLSSVTSNEIRGVPLKYDMRVGTWISDLAVKELDDRDNSLEKEKAFQDDQSYLRKAGVIPG